MSIAPPVVQAKAAAAEAAAAEAAAAADDHRSGVVVVAAVVVVVVNPEFSIMHFRLHTKNIIIGEENTLKKSVPQRRERVI